jgi:hypothetical protein
MKKLNLNLKSLYIKNFKHSIENKKKEFQKLSVNSLFKNRKKYKN